MATIHSDVTAHAAEVSAGERFPFGDNWRDFLDHLDDERIAEAEQSLMKMLGRETLEGVSFLDIGCGSGLFSLAAARLGARVHSFDFDPASVGCAQELRRRYPVANEWEIQQGSAIDREFLDRLGTYDIVYSWGVLHHTGSMWEALENVSRLVAPGGRLFISIYNDNGRSSTVWRLIKRTYNRVPEPLRVPYVLATWGPRELVSVVMALLRGKPMDYVRSWTRYKNARRGMDRWHDAVDWIGGYPFEVATPAEIFTFYRDRGFVLDAMVAERGNGCNEFVFSRSATPAPD
jgi:2-polyprenyl-6-hydroxyphenyl methylase/3-demethylubiquinone-9 3-methyltransferase